MKPLSLDELAGGVAGPPKEIEIPGFGTVLVRDVPYADMQALSSAFEQLDGDTEDAAGVATMAMLFEKTLTDKSGTAMSAEQAKGLAENSSAAFLMAANEAIMNALQADLDVDSAKKNSRPTGMNASGSASRSSSKRRTRTNSKRA